MASSGCPRFAQLCFTPACVSVGGKVPAYRRDSNSAGSGNGDYSETVRITSKCTDPLRPSVTNTVQSFSRRTAPNGREVVETSDTSTVTKSSSRWDSGVDTNTSTGSSVLDAKYPHGRHTASLARHASHAGRHGDRPGVIVEVRNTRK